MTDSHDVSRRFTLNDIDVGSPLYQALVVHAKEEKGEPIVYKGLPAVACSLEGVNPAVALEQVLAAQSEYGDTA